LADGAAELRHGEHHHVAHALSQIAVERGEALGELGEAEGELAALVALIGVGVPAAHVGKGNLEADVGLDELGDLLQAVAAAAAGVKRCGFAALSVFTASNVSRPVPWRMSRTPSSYSDSKPRRALTPPAAPPFISCFTSKSATAPMATAPMSPRRVRGSCIP